MESNNQEAGPPCGGTAESTKTELVVGLGNPGDNYVGTRHNAGFLVVDAFLRIADSFETCEWQPIDGILFEAVVGGVKVHVLKPMAYMNNSGPVVAETMERLDVSPQKLLVVSDDLDLELGRLRLRARGSSGGHKGVGSIAFELKTADFPRLRLGVGRPRSNDDSIIDYVLSPWASDKMAVVNQVLEQAVMVVRKSITDGIEPCTIEVSEVLSDKDNANSKGDPEVEKV